jgi:hypothetical protein
VTSVPTPTDSNRGQQMTGLQRTTMPAAGELSTCRRAMGLVQAATSKRLVATSINGAISW